MKNLFIHIKGRVQGVGFRPFVHRIARKHGIQGWVSNGNSGVKIEVSGTEEDTNLFLQELKTNYPSRARITEFLTEEVEYKDFTDFEIKQSNSLDDSKTLLISPDFAICKDCRQDIRNCGDRRFEYPFTTCTKCGPRFSIMKNIPYDRDTTTMEDFQMCKNCQSEYESIVDRRFYSQTNSCPECGIELKLHMKGSDEIITNQDQILSQIEKSLIEGKILACKGIGGFLLMVDATNPEAINRLRAKKNRPRKPFAVMFPDCETVLDCLIADEDEKRCLESQEAPIVLLRINQSLKADLSVNEIAPGLNRIGAMLPNAPLLQIISDKVKRPLIATSANLSSDPIIYDNASAISELNEIGDLVLVNNRDIHFPQDDSVVKYSNLGNKILIRRSRGYAPMVQPIPSLEESILAMGADLKSAFSIQHLNNTYTSQYLGDLELLNSQDRFDLVLNRLSELIEFEPRRVLVDLHAGYFSHQKGQKIADNKSLQTQAFQHHEAHFAAVLGENGKQDSKENILGIIWDGTGYGYDGNIWGGEFILYSEYSFQRLGHIPYRNHISGEKMSKEPRLSLLSYASENEILMKEAFTRFKPAEKAFYQQNLKSRLKTSSMGRFFDSMASLLALIDINSFEGHGAMLLEKMADEYYNGEYDIPDSQWEVVWSEDYINQIMELAHKDLHNEYADIREIAAKFHWALTDLIKYMAREYGISRLAFSGGTFQNSVLIDLLVHRFSQDYELIFHKDLSPNDECISYGQLVSYYINCQRVKQESQKNKTQNHVSGYSGKN